MDKEPGSLNCRYIHFCEQYMFLIPSFSTEYENNYNYLS